MSPLLIVALLLFAVLGAPLFAVFGAASMSLFAGLEDTSVTGAAHDVFSEKFADSPLMVTIPLFIFAGYMLAESGTPRRIVELSRAWLGWMPGGLAIVCIGASAFFTTFTGGSGITIVAIGGLLLPALLKNGYPEKFSLGLVTTGGALGITFFPCLPLIVYGIVAGLQETPPGVEKLQLDKLILAGIMPGLLIIGLLVLYSMVFGITHKLPRSSFDRKEAFSALWEAKWELLLPFIIAPAFARFGPVPAAALTALYVLVFEVFFTKDLSLTRDLPRVAPDSMVLVGAIFVKLCAATVLTFYFVDAQVADRIFETLTCGPEAQAYLAAHSDAIGTCREAVDALAREGKSAGGLIDSSLTFLLALNVFLLVVGMLMDIFSAIVVIVPLIMGIALHFNINPYHLGVVFLINLEIGYLMPPMGLNLFIAGFRFNRPVPDLYRVVLPFIGIFGTALLITTYVPSLTLALLPESKPAAVAPVTGVGDAAPGEAPALGGTADDCAEPRPDESFDDFSKRCDFGE
ncbi:MAG: TRAP transporter large permease [Polyangiales bacterium]